MPTPGPSRISETYLELRGDDSVKRTPLTSDFWPDLIAGRRRLEGRLVMGTDLSESMTHWEMHPAGDEVLLLLSGRVLAVLEDPAGDTDETFPMEPGEAFVVPRGRWHRIEVVEPGQMVFITAGEGTEHKPISDS